MLCNWHWFQSHMMLRASSMAPQHSLYQNNSNEMLYDFFGHVLPLALTQVTCDTDGIVNGITAFRML